MSTENSFKSAAEAVKNLARRPSNDHLLQLYALYKQGTEGDVSGKRPGMLDMKGRAKYDSWAGLKGMSGDEAQKKYVQLVQELQTTYG